MKLGSTVTLTYTGTLDDGTVFGTATVENPLKFQTGMDLVIPGLEQAILEMTGVGEKKSLHISQYDAYGEYMEDKFEEIAAQLIPRALKVGDRVPMANDEGERFLATVLSVGEKVRFDMNHPLAGKDLNFEIEIIDIVDAPEGFVPAAERQKMLEENRPSAVPFDQM